MSHFPVLVIGPDHENQLAPYHEFECTGINDEFVVEVDETEAVRAEGVEYHGLKTIAVGEMPDIDGEHKFGYAVMDGDTVVKAVRRTNPAAKWDWYLVGGRWLGAFRLKPGHEPVLGSPGVFGNAPRAGYADIALKGQIDFDRMRDDAEAEARALWTKVRQITEGASWESWPSVRGRIAAVETAREVYAAQPALVILKASGDESVWSWSGPNDDLALDLDVFARKERESATTFFAFVRDGKWFEKGSMGWFGMATDEMDDNAWNRKFNAMLDALPDDTLLTLVDCHI